MPHLKWVEEKNKLPRKVESHQGKSMEGQQASQKYHKPGIGKNPRSNQQHKTHVKTTIKFLFIIKVPFQR